jgi:hypothetical protein
MAIMFYEVRILTPKGDLKKVVSTQELSKAHWQAFNGTKLSNLESLILLREYKKQIKSAEHYADGNTEI